MRINVARSSLGLNLFADFYAGSDDRLLVIYFRGATSADDYEKRRATEPEAILYEWWGVTKHLVRTPALLVVPAPPALIPNRRLLAREIVSHIVCELLPAAGISLPDEVGCVGFSYGAMLSTGVACHLSSCRKIATIGGVGMLEVAQASSRTLAGREFRCFVNEDDPLDGASDAFAAYARPNGVQVSVERSPGGHYFSDYSSAGAVERAFEFVIAKKNETDRHQR